MASSATALVRSIVRRTELAFLGEWAEIGASRRSPVLSNDLSARVSGYRCLIEATTACVKGETVAILLAPRADATVLEGRR